MALSKFTDRIHDGKNHRICHFLPLLECQRSCHNRKAGVRDSREEYPLVFNSWYIERM
ncbi:MAG: hypothetical protein Q8891_02190 [Bacteroidota bacterium]|nr:hypothetical protein [Bacteroidota bacterium]